MWNPVELVAKHHHIDPAALVDFAISRDSKYAIAIDTGTAMVSNWHVEDLLKDFKTEQEELEDEATLNFVSQMESCPHISGVDVGCEFDGPVNIKDDRNSVYIKINGNGNNVVIG
jgi:hypothetical protein